MLAQQCDLLRCKKDKITYTLKHSVEQCMFTKLVEVIFSFNKSSFSINKNPQTTTSKTFINQHCIVVAMALFSEKILKKASDE